MKNTLRIIGIGILYVVYCTPSFANVITGQASIPDGYYNQVDQVKGADNILNTLHSIIGNHEVLNYKSLESHYEQTDFYADTLWDMYSTCRFTMEDANKTQNAVCDAWNKEHLVCQSWFSGGGPKSDLFNVYPTDARVNGMRSNFAYGEVSGAWGTGISNNKGHALGKVGSNTFSGYTGTVFEPYDDYKGDFARSFMYMAACYRNGALNDSYGSAMYTSSPTNLTAYAQNLLMKWHRDDPVSQKEIDRNQAVYGEQGNRNPFIDYPDLAEYIWGLRVGQTIDLSSMKPTCEGGGQVVERYGVNYLVNGELIHVDSVKGYASFAILDTMPESCSTESNVFAGWTETPITGTTDERPDVLYASGASHPAPTADTYLYAVFAHSTTEIKENAQITETIIFKDKNLESGKEVSTVEQGTVKIVFDKGTNTNAPKYYDAGTAVRVYGGGTMTVTASNMTRIDLTFGADDKSNAITTNVGTFTSPTWTGKADEVVFTVGGTKDHRRFASVAVTCDGEGTVTTYSRYLTSCNQDQATDYISLDNNRQTSARKLLINGHLYIQVDNKLYNLQGQQIQ